MKGLGIYAGPKDVLFRWFEARQKGNYASSGQSEGI